MRWIEQEGEYVMEGDGFKATLATNHFAHMGEWVIFCPSLYGEQPRTLGNPDTVEKAQKAANYLIRRRLLEEFDRISELIENLPW